MMNDLWTKDFLFFFNIDGFHANLVSKVCDFVVCNVEIDWFFHIQAEFWFIIY